MSRKPGRGVIIFSVIPSRAHAPLARVLRNNNTATTVHTPRIPYMAPAVSTVVIALFCRRWRVYDDDVRARPFNGSTTAFVEREKCQLATVFLSGSPVDGVRESGPRCLFYTRFCRFSRSSFPFIPPLAVLPTPP